MVFDMPRTPVDSHLTRDQLRSTFQDLGTWRQGDEQAPHKPLMLLWLLARVQRGQAGPLKLEEVRQAHLAAYQATGKQDELIDYLAISRERRQYADVVAMLKAMKLSHPADYSRAVGFAADAAMATKDIELLTDAVAPLDQTIAQAAEDFNRMSQQRSPLRGQDLAGKLLRIRLNPVRTLIGLRPETTSVPEVVAKLVAGGVPEAEAQSAMAP
jgi:hypothetical protein